MLDNDQPGARRSRSSTRAGNPDTTTVVIEGTAIDAAARPATGSSLAPRRSGTEPSSRSSVDASRRRPRPVLTIGTARDADLGLDSRRHVRRPRTGRRGVLVKVRAVDDFVPQDPQTSVITHTIVDDAVRRTTTRATTRRRSSCSRVDIYDDDTPNVVVAESGGSTLSAEQRQAAAPTLEAVRRLHDPPHAAADGAASTSRSSATARPTSSRSTASRSPAQYAAIGGIRPVDAVHRQRRHDGDDDHARRRLRARQLHRRRLRRRPADPARRASPRPTRSLSVSDASMTVAVAVAGDAVRRRARSTDVDASTPASAPGIFTGAVTYDAGHDTPITRSDGSNWLADGFLEGQRSGSPAARTPATTRSQLIDGPGRRPTARVMHLTLEHAIAARRRRDACTVTADRRAVVTFTPGELVQPHDVNARRRTRTSRSRPSATNVKPFPVLPHLLTRHPRPARRRGRHHRRRPLAAARRSCCRTSGNAPALQHRAAAARVLPGRHAQRLRRLEPAGQDRRGHARPRITGLGMVPDLDFRLRRLRRHTPFGEPTIVPGRDQLQHDRRRPDRTATIDRPRRRRRRSRS